MDTIADLIFVALSGLIVLTGLYLFVGLCCKGKKLSKVVGGLLGLTGLVSLVLTILPSC